MCFEKVGGAEASRRKRGAKVFFLSFSFRFRFRPVRAAAAFDARATSPARGARGSPGRQASGTRAATGKTRLFVNASLFSFRTDARASAPWSSRPWNFADSTGTETHF
jgi:hypothetical protein